MMQEIPKSWIQTTIDEIYTVIGGGTPSTKEPEYWESINSPHKAKYNDNK